MIKTLNPGVQEAIKEVKAMSLSKRLRLRYEEHLKEVRDRNARDDYVRRQGLEQGLEQGLKCAKRTVIANLLEKGIPEEEIMLLVECDRELIEEAHREKG